MRAFIILALCVAYAVADCTTATVTCSGLTMCTQVNGKNATTCTGLDTIYNSAVTASTQQGVSSSCAAGLASLICVGSAGQVCTAGVQVQFCLNSCTSFVTGCGGNSSDATLVCAGADAGNKAGCLTLSGASSMAVSFAAVAAVIVSVFASRH